MTHSRPELESRVGGASLISIPDNSDPYKVWKWTEEEKEQSLDQLGSKWKKKRFKRQGEIHRI